MTGIQLYGQRWIICKHLDYLHSYALDNPGLSVPLQVRRKTLEVFNQPGSDISKMEAVTGVLFNLSVPTWSFPPSSFRSEDGWFQGLRGAMARGVDLVQQLEALLVQQIQRGKEDGYSREEIMDAVCHEVMKRADLAVIATAGLDAELVTLLRWQKCVRKTLGIQPDLH